MLKRRAYLRLVLAFACPAATLCEAPAYGQDDLKQEVAVLKAENAAVREQLRKLESQQTTLLELIEDLR